MQARPTATKCSEECQVKCPAHRIRVSALLWNLPTLPTFIPTGKVKFSDFTSLNLSVTYLLTDDRVKSVKSAGFIAVDKTNKLIVFSVQGTDVKENPESLAISLNLDMVKTDLCKDENKEDGCTLHSGFFATAQSVKNEIAEIITETMAEYPEYQLVVTGHSLGGGLGAMIATMLRNDGHNVDLYTFGQPKIGGKDISKYIQNQAPAHGQNYRVTHDNDIVPQLPRPDWAPWGHFYPEYYITTKSGDVIEMDISKIDADFLTMKGNEGNSQARGSRHSLTFMIGARKGVEAHLDYLGPICNCDSTAPKVPKQQHHHHHGKHHKHSKGAKEIQA